MIMSARFICHIRRQVRVFALSLLAVVMPMLTSCDEHEPIDRNIHIGFVLCDDHSVMSLEAFRSAAHVNPVGVVFATETEDHPALAVMLFENTGVDFTNTLGLKCSTSGSVSAYDGYANSVALFNTWKEEKYQVELPDGSYEERIDSYFSPLGQWAFDSHSFGQSDFIPSYAEARLLQQSLSVVNPVIEELGGIPVGVSPEGGNCWYWTSTEDEADMENRAWLCSMATPGFQQTPKTEFHKARAIVALSY